MFEDLIFTPHLVLSRKKQIRPVDLSEVVDFKSILETYNQTGETPNGVHVLKREFDCPVIHVDNRAGKNCVLFV